MGDSPIVADTPGGISNPSRLGFRVVDVVDGRLTYSSRHPGWYIEPLEAGVQGGGCSGWETHL